MLLHRMLSRFSEVPRKERHAARSGWGNWTVVTKGVL
jgi:hypothetical protein